MAFLDENGLRYLWLKITAMLADYVAAEDGKGLSSNDFTDMLLSKLNGIASGANKTTVENVLTSSSTTNALSAAQGKALKSLIDSVLADMEGLAEGDMLKSVYDTDGDGIVDNAKKVNGLTVLTAVPVNAKFTDTTYSPASSSAAGLMSAADKTKLDAIEAEAEKNIVRGMEQNDSYIKIDTLDDDGSSYMYYTPKLIFGAGGSNPKIAVDLLPLATGSAYGAVKVDTALSGTSTNPVQNKVIAAELDAILSDLSTNYAKKTDITGVYKYKGSVATTSALPTTGNTTGDVYNVEERGINYAWNGTAWDNLGELFTVPIIANATIDSIVAS